jgi:hypothetical protein
MRCQTKVISCVLVIIAGSACTELKALEISRNFSAMAEWGSLESALSKAMNAATTMASRQGYRDCNLVKYDYWQPRGLFHQVTVTISCKKTIK